MPKREKIVHFQNIRHQSIASHTLASLKIFKEIERSPQQIEYRTFQSASDPILEEICCGNGNIPHRKPQKYRMEMALNRL
mgnify:CR=1 FL=1